MEPRVVFARAPVIQRQRQRQRRCPCPRPDRARLLSCDVLFHELLELGRLVVGVPAFAGLVDVFE